MFKAINKLFKRVLALLMIPFKMSMKFIMNPFGELAIGVMLIAAAFITMYIYRQGREDFSKLTRYMYMYNPTDNNSSYDTRGDNLAIQKDQENVGIFYESSLENNHANQRLDSDFAEMNDNMESSMNIDENIVKE